MEHLNMTTPDGAQLNLDALYKICPSCFTETAGKDGKVKRVVDFKKLRALLGDDAEDDAPEAYDFTWVGKRAAQREAAAPIKKTLRPYPKESVDWENTQNLYIEGDNLEVLKLLQNSYMGKVKMIYIDPPYNTGNDFVYHDDFAQSAEEYDEHNINEDGQRYYTKNTDSNGRFHSDWCSMMYARLMVARTLLTEQGVVFISIDENEVDNLHHICNEVFGEYNFIGQFVWQCKKGGGNDSLHIAVEHEYILAIAKNKKELNAFYEKYSDEYMKRYKETDSKGKFFWDTFKRKSGKQYYPITCPDGSVLEYDEDGNAISWLRSKDRFEQDLKDGEIRIVKIGERWSVQFKQRMPEGKKPRSIFTTNTVVDNKGTTSTGSSDVYSYFKKNVFSNPKPIELIEFLLGFGVSQSDLVVDFFSGSGTMADAIMKFNNKYKTSIRYILVQLQENIEDMLNSSSANAKIVAMNAIEVLDSLNKPHFLTELAKERIRRAGKILKDIDSSIDTGFRVFKCDTSNMKDIYFSPKDYSQELLFDLEDNIKEDRTDLDLLFDCMLRWGVELSLPLSSEKVGNCTIHNVNDGDLVACFDGKITDEVIDAIAELSPLRVVFRDSSFTEASQKMNLFELFKQKCGWSDEEVKNNVKVI